MFLREELHQGFIYLIKKYSENCDIVLYILIDFTKCTPVMVKFNFQHHYSSLQCQVCRNANSCMYSRN